MQLWLGILALVLNLIGYALYIRDILHGAARPQRIGWFIWAILNIIGAVNQVLNKGGYSSLFFVSLAFMVVIIFLLSLKYGQGGASRVDFISLALALGLLAYWVTVRDTRLSTLLAVFIDSIGLGLTLLKTYRKPESETYAMWILIGIAGILSLFSLPRIDWVIIIYPAYIAAGNSAVILTKFARQNGPLKQMNKQM
jgi:hypothetical protein